MNKIQIALSSPATYSALAMIIIGILTPLIPTLQGNDLIIVEVLLGGLTAYLNASHVQSASLTGSTKFGAVSARSTP